VTTDDSPRLAFVGAGQMGMPMVRRLLQAGRDVTVYARRAEVRDESTAIGAAATSDVHDAVRNADIVLVCLYSDAQVRELALGPEGFLGAMPRRATVVTHTTGSPATANALAAGGADRELRVVEAPVSGSADDIAAGHVTVLLGGDPDDVARVRDVVCAYGDPILLTGLLGSAQTVKLLNNALFTAQLVLAREVERIATSLGVEMLPVAAAVQSSAASYAMGVVERFGSVAAVLEAAGHFLRKDVAVIREVATELGVDLGVLGAVIAAM
jgi:3-hydroxyisobutyrate dehydrogenase-like beta-hydroxyacid dehydrogenase